MGFLKVHLLLLEARCVRTCSVLWKQRDKKSSLKSCTMFQANTGFWRLRNWAPTCHRWSVGHVCLISSGNPIFTCYL